MKVRRLFVFGLDLSAWSPQEILRGVRALKQRYEANGIPVVTGQGIKRETGPGSGGIAFVTDDGSPLNVDADAGVYLVGHGNSQEGMFGAPAEELAQALVTSGLARARKLCVLCCYFANPTFRHADELAEQLSRLGATTTLAAWNSFVSVVLHHKWRPASRAENIGSCSTTDGGFFGRNTSNTPTVGPGLKSSSDSQRCPRPSFETTTNESSTSRRTV